jgi:putative RNA 2'-phosphotransferase
VRDDDVKVSKFLSYVLRHHPESIGLVLEASGFVEVDLLLARCHANGRPYTRELLERIVRENPKKRFELSGDGARIRASQGHSIEVDLAYSPEIPPEVLFHGAPSSVVASILDEGLRKMARHHVHLAADRSAAREVGARRGKPVVLTVHAGRMHRDGHVFFRSTNGVWLTEHVPPRYLQVPERG